MRERQVVNGDRDRLWRDGHGTAILPLFNEGCILVGVPSGYTTIGCGSRAVMHRNARRIAQRYAGNSEVKKSMASKQVNEGRCSPSIVARRVLLLAEQCEPLL